MSDDIRIHQSKQRRHELWLEGLEDRLDQFVLRLSTEGRPLDLPLRPEETEGIAELIAERSQIACQQSLDEKQPVQALSTMAGPSTSVAGEATVEEAQARLLVILSGLPSALKEAGNYDLADLFGQKRAALEFSVQSSESSESISTQLLALRALCEYSLSQIDTPGYSSELCESVELCQTLCRELLLGLRQHYQKH